MSDWKRSVYDQENRGSDVHPNMQSRGMFAKNTSSFHDARKSVIAASYVLDQVSGTPTVFHDEMADMAVSVPVSDGDTGILRNPELDEEEVQRDSVGRSLAVKALLGDRDTSDGNFVVAESAGDRKDC
ncbi:MAG: hypothetical protein ABEJ03_03500 [Candidatus Nanohaloarchaea archaeon]